MNYEFPNNQLLMDHGLPTIPEKTIIAIPDSVNVLRGAFNWYFSRVGETFQTDPVYNDIAAWLHNNEGRGLLMFGDCGRGKTLLARYILPAILIQYANLVPVYYDARAVNTRIDDAMKHRVCIIDDLGTEDISVVYGQRRCAFDEIINAAEHSGNIVIATSNLTEEELISNYGERTMERIKATMNRVLFQGPSLRRT